jgi:hypothetical protein
VITKGVVLPVGWSSKGAAHPLARRWIADKTLYLNEHVGPLLAGNAGSLYQIYTITKRYPRRGTTLSLGVGSRDASGTSGTFKTTPLSVWARQPRSAHG